MPAKRTTKSKSKPKAKRSTAKKTPAKKSNTKFWTANKKMAAFFGSFIVILFALARLGLFGVFLYNVTRLAVGSLAIIFLLIVLFIMFMTVFKKDFFRENKRFLPGLALLFFGLLLVFHARYDVLSPNKNALVLAMSDLRKGQVTHFLGGGSLGDLFFGPAKALFSVIGVYIIVGILWLIALYFMAPALIARLRIFLKRNISETRTRMADRAEAKRAAALLEEKAKAQEEAERNLRAIEAEEVPLPSEPLFEENTASDFSEIPIAIPDTPVSPTKEMGTIQPQEEVEDDQEPISFERSVDNEFYQLPTIDLLEEIPTKNQAGERENVRKNIQILERTLESFKIAATVESAVVGPSVTKYEIKLATGVKVSRVVNLSDDLALALAAKDVRIEAPIPGKSLIGIEIPNSEVATVGFRELWENAQPKTNSLLELPLGKALDGTIRTFDMTRMPHLLVAGSTGSGKSVAVNGIITSILMKALPSEVKFLMVDPKMVELSVYNDIPHLLIPVVTNPRKASRALQKVVDEMENRYELFSQAGVRNIAGYNEKIEKYNAQSNEKYQTLPLIVVIVDELSDLMMVASKEVEDAIIRLGQKARAAGIHMILATQRPSVDVISGLIKANVPSRVAFAVSSGTDSRTIIDTNGAEKLLGRGDMLFKPIDENHPVRLQGAFLSDADVESVVNFIKNQSQADYDESFDPGEAEEDSSRGTAAPANSADPLFEEARNMVISAQKASTAQLQRALKVGFNRASDLMNELEAAGIVGPAKGTTPRKVLVTQDGEFLEGQEFDEA
ncbi:DNA translocase FtsK [Lactococcus formosensis]|uniref:DNA translocase FtsK n=1 Tax=Lactococcus formosensis TaxID=1281486 RepID=A0A9X4NWU9_9LACT|nr:DNA translocase FtsK [Lactococcus formosensis]MDG6110585.1 DNA translocase FtsK [Lactococcus formosensis]MDG6117164.1 DNA translocase FtsK [Lactococcus formosensis]MDG6125826.1 DNA translocase FtsK [Lactococcus formosensis]MDG6132132.1 DNA translocase FtsK [Lactococcus formosensis]MDG6134129.1 DNA translocase FtsK [Lactococcus formosensis]